jgi:hypothetical protein
VKPIAKPIAAWIMYNDAAILMVDMLHALAT